MVRRSIGLVLAVVFILALAAALWAAREKGRGGMKQTMGMKQAGAEKDRCTRTCSTLMNFYNTNYPKMKAREGNKQCWDTCWSRFGKGKMAGVSEKKAFWMEKRAMNMRANQCAQACWRMHQGNSKTVEVGGWRSMPRSIVCAKAE